MIRSLVFICLFFILLLACNFLPVPQPAPQSAQNGSEWADYGDAPDPSFPTLLAKNGARAVDVTQFWLGHLGEPPSIEAMPKIVNRDEMDDGLVDLLVANKVTVTFQAVKSADSMPQTVYFNLLVDLNGDGKWQVNPGPGGPAREWVVENQPLRLSPGESVRIKSEFQLTQGNLEAWMRATLTDRPAEGDWTGTGGFAQGEVEDYRIGPADDWNVECASNPLELLHGNPGNITLRVAGGRGAPSQFRIVSVAGTQGVPGDPNANEITVTPLGVPAPDPGFTSYGPGPHIRVTTKNDPPARKMEYEIVVRLEGTGRVETEKCIVKVTHGDVQPVGTATRTLTTIIPPPRSTGTPTRTPTTIVLTPRSTDTPTRSKPVVNVNSPVKIGTDLVVTGRFFPPGLARKLVLDPRGNAIYNIEIQIPTSGILSATFYIPGPAGRWTLVIRFAGEEIRVPFDVS